jgi:hypothetical protein
MGIDATPVPDNNVPETPQSAQALGEAIVTAVLTAAVVPFPQAVVKKATEDTYAGTRHWLHRLFQGAKTEDDATRQRGPELLIVQDLDPHLNSYLYLPTNISDRALRSLAQLNVAALVAEARVTAGTIRIYWDDRAGQWRTDG